MKNEILKTAGELFFKYGVRSVSVDDICNEMHISKKTFYVHFQQKDELIECLLNSMRDEDIKKQAEFLNTDNVIIASIVNYKNLVKSFNVDKHIAFVYDLEKYYPKIMKKHREEKKLNLINSIKSMILLGIKQGFFREDINIDLMSAYIASSFYAFLQEKDMISMSNRKKIDFLIDTFYRIISTPKGLECYFENIK